MTRENGTPIAAKGRSETNDLRDREWKARALAQFERWSGTYQGSWCQRIFCNPTSRMLLERLTTFPHMRVLDVGCGTGQLLADVARRQPDASLCGIDLSPGMVTVARRHLSSAGTRAEIVQADSARLPFPDESFDLVLCTHSFHHYPDQKQVAAEFARVLSRGGAAMILDGDPGPRWGYLLFEVLIAWFEGAIHHCSAAEMEALLSDAGFADVVQSRAFAWSPVLLSVARRKQG